MDIHMNTFILQKPSLFLKSVSHYIHNKSKDLSDKDYGVIINTNQRTLNKGESGLPFSSIYELSKSRYKLDYLILPNLLLRDYNEPLLLAAYPNMIVDVYASNGFYYGMLSLGYRDDLSLEKFVVGSAQLSVTADPFFILFANEARRRNSIIYQGKEGVRLKTVGVLPGVNSHLVTPESSMSSVFKNGLTTYLKTLCETWGIKDVEAILGLFEYREKLPNNMGFYLATHQGKNYITILNLV